MLTKAIAVAVGVLAGGAGLAVADGTYFGITGGVARATSGVGSFGPEESMATLTNLGAIAGYRMDNGGNFFGGEFNAEFSIGDEFTDDPGGQTCSAGANGPYYCRHDATLRLRGIAGTTLANGNEVFGSLGVVQIRGESATGTSTVAAVTSTGFTAGLGMTMSGMGSAGTTRVEIVLDKADNSNEPSGYQPTYQAVSLIVGFMF